MTKFRIYHHIYALIGIQNCFLVMHTLITGNYTSAVLHTAIVAMMLDLTRLNKRRMKA